MKKFLVLFIALFSMLVLVGCTDQLETLEWVQTPNSVYEVGKVTDLQFKESVEVRINGVTFNLATAETIEGLTITGLVLDQVGDHTLTVKYNSVSIQWSYKIVKDEVDLIVPDSDTSWYVDKESPYIIDSVEDLYGLAELVNVENVDFAGEEVRLAVDIDLTNYIWTPIGEGARKVAELIAENVVLDVSEITPTVIDNKNYYYLGSYGEYKNQVFAEKNSDGSFDIYESDRDVSLDVGMFSGIFDGQGHTIKGLSDIGYAPLASTVYANSSKAILKGYVFGLFGLVKGDVVVKNLNFEDVAINGAYVEVGQGIVSAAIDSVGAVIGYANKEQGSILIDNVKVLSGSIQAFAAAGGLVGRSYLTGGEITITNSENRANIFVAENHAGGIIGYVSGANLVTLSNVNNYGNIKAVGLTTGAGAITGQVSAKFTVQNVKNFGEIDKTHADKDTFKGMVGKFSGNQAHYETNMDGIINYGILK